MTSDMYKLLMATNEYNASGLHPEKHSMGDGQKQALMLLEADDYVVLSLREQLDYYGQRIQSEFRKSIGDLADQAAVLARGDDASADQ